MASKSFGSIDTISLESEFYIAKTLEELTSHGSDDFPVGIYEMHLSGSLLPYTPLHWHRELQFVVVTQGEAFVVINEKNIPLKMGEGCFINSEVLHSISSHSPNCTYITFVVSPSFFGKENSVIQEKYLQPLFHNMSFPTKVFNPAIPWEKSILDTLVYLFNICKDSSFGYELLTQKGFLEIAYALISHLPTAPSFSSQQGAAKNKSIKLMLEYIHLNYNGKITLEDISQAANIGREECCRIFKRTIQTSPFEYLNNYRLNQSMDLLRSTDLNVTQIALEVGFGSVSYYIDKFKTHTGYTPNKFRHISSIKK